MSLLILIGRGLDLREETTKEDRYSNRGQLFTVQFSGCWSETIDSLIEIPVAIARGFHLYPSRTQKLSLSAPMVLGWRRPGRVGRCRIPFTRKRAEEVLFLAYFPKRKRKEEAGKRKADPQIRREKKRSKVQGRNEVSGMKHEVLKNRANAFSPPHIPQ